MADATRRPLKIPTEFISYLERHKIYELLHNVTAELLIMQPDDHILKLKQLFERLRHTRNRSRIILLAPPHFESVELAELISEITGVVPVNFEDLLKSDEVKQSSASVVELSQLVSAFLSSDRMLIRGWILFGFPRSHKEARLLQKKGILPTHVFELYPPTDTALESEEEDMMMAGTKESNASCVTIPVSPTVETNSVGSKTSDEEEPLLETMLRASTSREPDLPVSKQAYKTQQSDCLNLYLQNLPGIQKAYGYILQKINILDKTMEDVANECADSLQNLRNTKAPVISRVVLLGPRGSGKKTQAEYISSQFGMIHVRFEVLYEQKLQSDDEVGKKLRECQKSGLHDDKLLLKILQEQLLRRDCLSNGWVLTGYPNNVSQFQDLDSSDLYPNRVIIFNISDDECIKRVAGRRVNKYTGSSYHITSKPPVGKSVSEVATHPKDKMDIVKHDIHSTRKELEEMAKYCGRSATYIDASHPIREVSNMVLSAVMRPAPATSPKTPLSESDTIKRMDAMLRASESSI